MASLLDIIRKKMDSGTFKTKHLYWIGAVLVFAFALFVRYMPAANMEYLQALDPYMIARMSAAIVEHGHLPAIDVWRYFPFHVPTYMLNLGNIYIPAYLFHAFKLFGMNFVTWAKFYPALMGALTVVPIYLLGKEAFDRKTGLMSAFFLAAAPAIMHRSSAGWFEKEPIANLLMVTSLYCFVKAWKDEDWRYGIGSGVALGVAHISWGGAAFLQLLFPLTVLALTLGVPAVMAIPALVFGDGMKKLQFHKGLVAAFVPTGILATILPFILNGSASTYSLPNQYFILSLGTIGVLAIRYIPEKYNLVESQKLSTLPFWTMGGGLFFLLLSPLLAPTLYGYIEGIISAATQSGVAVIGQTVAENTPATISQVVSQLGASISASILPGARSYAEFFSGWTFSIVGLAVLLISVLMLVLKQYFDVEGMDVSSFTGGVSIAAAVSTLVMYLSFPGSQAAAFIPALVLVALGGTTLFFLDYAVSGDIEQWIGASILIWALVFLFTAFTGAFVAAAVLAMIQGAFLVYTDGGQTKEFHIGWYHVLILFWMASTVYGAMQKSRLLFLTATPVAMVAGIGLSSVWDRLVESDFWGKVSGEIDSTMLARGVAAFIVVAAVIVNGAAVFATAGSIGGSPNQAWMENMDYMKNETPPGSTILSWWDYGYWFESIGERTAVADGGNMGFYGRDNNVSKVNFPLAEFLTSHNPSNHTEWLNELSVDYIVLDNTMIGKYSAVSQIANRDNQNFNSMRTLNCRTQQVGGRRGCMRSTVQNNTVIHYAFGRSEILVPVEQVGGGGVRIAGAPLWRAGRQTIPIENVCTSAGILDMHEDEGTTGSLDSALNDAFRNNRPFGGCIAFDPSRGPSRIVMVPPAIMESTLVRLYLMDGAGVDFVNEVFDNGFVKMWEVEG